MFDFIKTKYIIHGIEIHLRTDAEALVRLMKFSKKGDHIDLPELIFAGLFNEIPKKAFKKKEAVSIVFTGDGVLTRKVKKETDNDPIKLIKAILPDGNASDFIYSVYEESEMINFSIIRRSLIEPYLDFFISQHLYIVEVNAGCHIIQESLKYCTYPVTTIRTGNYEIKVKDDTITEITTKDCFTEKITICGTTLDSSGLIALSGFFYYISGINQKESISEFRAISKEFEYFSKTKHALTYCLISCFIILLINFLIFDHYNKLRSDLESKVTSYNSMLEEHDSLQVEFDRKKEFLENAGLAGKSKISYYADRLASDLPSSLSFEMMDIFPIMEQDGNDEDIIAEKGVIKISGYTPNPVILNEWVTVITTYKWVEKVNIQNYIKATENNMSKFELLVQIR